MKEQVFIAIDSGKFSTKGILEHKGRTLYTMFRTKLQETSDSGVDLQPNSFKVEFENKQYLLGDMVSEDRSDHTLSKESAVHKVAIYTVIAQLMKKAKLQFHNVQLHVAINAPINVYKNQKLKNSYQTYMENNNQAISIRINDQPYLFHIRNITICFEGMGTTYVKQVGNNHSSAVIDIGGLNATLNTFYKGIHPDLNSMLVSPLGISHLKATIERELVEMYGVSISSNDLEQIINRSVFTHYGKIIDDSKEIIEKTKTNHVDNIINYAKQHGYTFNQDKICFVGGGSLLLQKEINVAFPNAIIEADPVFSNVKSFIQILKVKHAS